MNKYFAEVRLYESYYFSQTIKNILEYRFKYLRDIEGFFCDNEYLEYIKPFPKYSALHSFIAYIADTVIHEENCDVDLDLRQRDVVELKEKDSFGWNPKSLPINKALNFYNIKHESFNEWLENSENSFIKATSDDIYEYLMDLRLCGNYDSLLEKIAQDTFFVLFQNRRLLMLFNDMMSEKISSTNIKDISINQKKFFSRSGVLKRTNIPSWVKKAVYFRDRGKCIICLTDLSGTLNINNQTNFDHIIPLAQGGLNDVTNIQLLCKICNQKKLHRNCETSEYYELWYQMD